MITLTDAKTVFTKATRGSSVWAVFRPEPGGRDRIIVGDTAVPVTFDRGLYRVEEEELRAAADRLAAVPVDFDDLIPVQERRGDPAWGWRRQLVRRLGNDSRGSREDDETARFAIIGCTSPAFMLRPRARSTAWDLPRAYAALLDRWQEAETGARAAERVCTGCGDIGPEARSEFALWRHHGHVPRESDRALCPDCFAARYLPYTGQRTGETYNPKGCGRPSPKMFRCTRCHVRPALVWDHCHDHMRIRGPLCGTCNGAAAERRSTRTADGLRYLMSCPSCQAAGMLPPRTLVDLAQDAATEEGCPDGKSHPPGWRSGGGSTVSQLREELIRTGAVTVTSLCGHLRWNTVYSRAQLEGIARERLDSLLGVLPWAIP